jgi:hypothetical protein
MDDDDFNSSDLEFESHPNPFFSAGASSIQAIIDQATEDRIQSKRATKMLAFAEASPKTEYLTALWSNRFLAFVKYTLKKRYPVLPLYLWLLALVRSLWTQCILSEIRR